LLEFQSLIDKSDKEFNLKFPRICLMGIPHSGKSLLLESIIGLDIIQINQNLEIKRPLELNLIHITSGESYAVFKELEDQKITDFSKIPEIIQNLQEMKIKNYQELSNPIILNIFSQKFPNITFIDLPGTPYIYPGECPMNKKSFPSQLASEYAEDNLNLLICVIPVNYDNFGEKLYCLNLIENPLIKNHRILGVLTKIDLINEYGENANVFKQLLYNEICPLKFGYIGIKNRSLTDLNNKVTLKESIKNEKNFFEKESPIFGKFPENKVGYEVLIKKLQKHYFEMIKENLSNELKDLNEKIIKNGFIYNYQKKKNIINILQFINDNSFKESEAFNPDKKIKLEKEEDTKNFKDLIDFINENAEDD